MTDRPGTERSTATSRFSNINWTDKNTKASDLGALAFPGTLRGIARGTHCDFQQISCQLHLMTIFCVLRTWLWKYNTGDMLIILMQAVHSDSAIAKSKIRKPVRKPRAPKRCSLYGYPLTDFTSRRHRRAERHMLFVRSRSQQAC